MIELGQYNTLTVARFEPQGAYLSDETFNSVLLPTSYMPKGLKVGDELEVFVYNDSEQRPIATTLKPLVTLNDFAVLTVKSVTAYGAFMDWGLAKDLFIPFSEQARKVKEGERHLVYVYLDEETDRLVGSTKLARHLRQKLITVQEGEEVELTVWHPTDLGMRVIVNKRFLGMLFKDEIFQPLELGQQLTGYIKKVRSDGHIDCILQKGGYKQIEPNAQRILKALEDHSGFLPVHDKSDPQAIQNLLQMSKKVFKKSVGSLYKQRLIVIEPDGIRLK